MCVCWGGGGGLGVVLWKAKAEATREVLPPPLPALHPSISCSDFGAADATYVTPDVPMGMGSSAAVR